jgi:hypothetical protein
MHNTQIELNIHIHINEIKIDEKGERKKSMMNRYLSHRQKKNRIADQKLC